MKRKMYRDSNKQQNKGKHSVRKEGKSESIYDTQRNVINVNKKRYIYIFPI